MVYMGLQYLIIGCFFLLNPYFSIIDILPDFIGCIFLLKGLSKVSKISVSFEDAAKNFRYLLIVSLVRLCTTPLIADTSEVWPLIVVLCAGLIEAFLTIRAFVSLFDGFTATSHAPEAALYSRWRVTRQFTFVFLIVRQVVCILPELCLLSNSEYGIVTPDGVRSMATYRLPLILLGMFIGLVVGIAWFVQIRRYLKNVLNDKAYEDHLASLYQHRYSAVSAVYIADNLHTAMTLLMVGIILSMELIFDGVNYLPHIIGAIFIAIAASKLASLPKKAANSKGKAVAKLALLYGGISIPRFIYSIIFTNRIFGEYLNSKEEGLPIAYSDVLVDYLKRDFTTIYGFAALVILSVVEAVCLILLLRALYHMLRELLACHTRASLPPPPPPEGLENYTPQKDEFALNMHRTIFAFVILGVLVSISMIVATAAPAFFPSYWLVDSLLRLVWVVVGYYLVSKLREEIDSHYSFRTREEDLHELTH